MQHSHMQKGCVSVIGNFIWDQVFQLYWNSITRVEVSSWSCPSSGASSPSSGCWHPSAPCAVTLEQWLLVYQQHGFLQSNTHQVKGLSAVA